jgi:acetoin utilization protein AcuC
LLVRIGALRREEFAVPALATDEQLYAVHVREFIDTVKTLSAHYDPIEHEGILERFGLNTEDTPWFTNIHEVTAAVVGGTIAAADMVMRGEVEHALHMAGGLHHAMREKASGFCVYNDAAAAIAHVKKTYGARVLYVDTDVHHGDGVQWIFYDDPDVCTFSIHETGKYLYPGTGFVNERGEGAAFGKSVNLPMEPYTEDESWMACFSEALEEVVAKFKPDLIISQHGCDAHQFDPLSHMACSMEIYHRMPKVIHQLAHKHCGGRWVALGGGGYDWWRVVPRAWAMLWLEMNDHPIVATHESVMAAPIPEDWLAAWQAQAPLDLPRTWLDEKSAWAAMPRRSEITVKNAETLYLSLLYT